MKALLLTPNPATNKVSVVYDSATGGVTTIGVYTLAGVELMSQKVNSKIGINKQNLNVTKLVKGVYIVKVTGGGVNSSTQLAIEKE